MALIRGGALNDFPFGELSAEDFHRLVLHLLNRDTAFRAVENYGATGSDGGVDLIAETAELTAVSASSNEKVTLVQVKRVRKFTLTEARGEIERLRRSGAYKGFEGYLLVASCVPSAKAIDELRKEGSKLGLKKVSVWEPSLLTAKLLEHRDLLEFFFGIADSASWLRGPITGSSYVKARERIRSGSPLIVIVGSRPEFDLSAEVLAGNDPPGDPLRRLVESGVIDTLVAQGSDLTPAVGDLLPIDESNQPPTGRSLWQPQGAASLGALVSHLAAARAYQRPVFAVMGCDEEEIRGVSDELSLHRWDEEGTEVLLFAPPGFDDPDPDLNSAGGQVFLRSVHEAVAKDWLASHLVEVDFDEEFSYDDIVAGLKVQGGIARMGMWSDELDYLPPLTKHWQIEDLPGTGKTAQALRIGFRHCPNSTYYIDLATVPSVTTADLGRLASGIERRGGTSVLVVDNCQGSRGEVDRFLELMKRRGHRGVQVVTALTRPFTSLDISGQEGVVEDPRWEVRRDMLGRWCEEQMGSSSILLRTAEAEARNLWHFFYLLRGGPESLSADLESAREADGADLVWYMVAAQTVFLNRSATVRNLFAGVTEYGLWPLALDIPARGRWLIDAIDTLLESRRIVAVGGGFVCRHQYEAYGVLRLSFDLDGQLTEAPPREASISLFARAMPRIEVPDALQGDPGALGKWEVRSFAMNQLNAVLTRQGELELAIGDDPRLQDAVDIGWAPLVDLIEGWPIHPLYWLFARSGLSFNLLRFSPFARLRKMVALESVECVSDAIDIEYLVKGLLAYDALPTVRYRVQAPYLRRDLEAVLASVEETISEIDDSDSRYFGRTLVTELERLTDITEEVREDVDKLREVETEPLVLPFKREVDGATGWTLGHGTTWLEHHSSRFVQMAAQVDRRRLLDSMTAIGPTRPLLLAQLWLLSPDLGRDLFAMMPEDWRLEAIEAVKESPNSYTALHLAWHHDFLAIFAGELAAVAPEIASWLESEDSGFVGEFASSAPNLGRRVSELAPTADNRQIALDLESA